MGEVARWNDSSLSWNMPGLTWNGDVPKPKSMSQLRVLLGFAHAADHVLEETALAVINNLYGHPAYPTPPVTKVNLQAALDAFTAAMGAQAQGGTAATADKNDKGDTLIGLLRQLAAYVQANCGGVLATLLESGFEAVSTSRAQAALAKPQITRIDNGNSGQLIVRVRPVANARSYEARYAVVTNGQMGAYQSAGIYTQSRNMAVGGLTPGSEYSMQVRAVGGSTGYSDWSDAVSHRSL